MNPENVVGLGPRGRPKGAPNKLGHLARENIIAVFDRVGGIDAMTRWAGEFPGDFYRIYSRLIPGQTGDTPRDKPTAAHYTDEELMAIIAERSTSRDA